MEARHLAAATNQNTTRPCNHVLPSRPQANQEVILVAVGPEYKTWEGGIDPATGVAHIGISYDKLCQSVRPGNIIKVRHAEIR